MSIADDLKKENQPMPIEEFLEIFEIKLSELIARYEQYLIGLQKHEPFGLMSLVDRMVKRYSNVPINNTMYKVKFHTLVARYRIYKERWNRIQRLIEDGKYSRDRFIRDMHLRERASKNRHQDRTKEIYERCEDVDRLFHEFLEARKACHLPVEKLTVEQVAATIEKCRPSLIAKLGTDDISFRVVVENGKPKIKARRNHHIQ